MNPVYRYIVGYFYFIYFLASNYWCMYIVTNETNQLHKIRHKYGG